MGKANGNPAINVKIERAEAEGRENIYTTVNPLPNNIQYAVKQEAYEMNCAPPATDFLQIQHNRYVPKSFYQKFCSNLKLIMKNLK